MARVPNNPFLSPADDTASQALIDTQTAITKVKEIITDCVMNGVNEGETTERLNKAIAEECKRIESIDLREQMRKALVTAARKWHYQLKQTYRILDRNLQQQSNSQGVDLSKFMNLTPYQRNVEFRKIQDDGTAPGIPLIEDYERSVKLAIKAMSAEPPKVVTVTRKKDGKQYTRIMPLRNRAEMAVRYDANVKNMQELISQGVLWAWTSSHPNCSPRCKDWQGRLYSLFKGTVEINGIKYGEKGYIDGIKYDPIDEALRGENGDGNGIISGYGCRHRLIAYKHGSKPPTDYSEAEIAREYAIDKQQRSYENRIRQMKTEERQLRAAGYLEEAKKLRKRWRKLTLDYEIYSIEHKRAFYRYRCVIDRAESEDRFYLEDYLKKAIKTGNKKAEQLLTNYKNQYILKQEKLRQPQDFVLAKTVQEAESYMSKRAITVSYDGITNIKSLNQANRTFAYLSELYQIKPLKAVSTKMYHRNALAEANGEGLNISPEFANNPTNDAVKRSSSEWIKDRNKRLNELKEILPKYQKTFNEALPEHREHYRKQLKKVINKIKELEEDLKFNRSNVIYEGREVESVITHETGHIIADQNFQQISRPMACGGHTETIRKVFNRAIKEGDIYKISQYANTDVREFFAECFTIYEMKEENLPGYIQDMMNEVLK